MKPARRKPLHAATRTHAKRGLKLLAAVAVLVPVSSLLESVKVFREWEKWLIKFDVQMERDTDPRVARVVITREDYASLFHGESPLNPNRLWELIAAVAAGSPAVVAVDIETKDPQFAALRGKSLSCPLIWVRTAEYSNRDRQYWPANVLGEPCPISENQGLGVYLPDSDGLIRQYSQSVATNQGNAPTLPWAVLKAAGLNREPEPSTTARLIRFVLPTAKAAHSRLVRLPAGEVMRLSREPAWRQSVLKDKLVILGGQYSVEDEHDTPAGFVFGMDILADTIQTELKGGGRVPTPGWLEFAIAFSAAAILWLLTRHRSLKQVAIYGSIAVVVLAASCSVIVAKSLLLWPLFIIILAVVEALQVWGRVKASSKPEPKT